MDFVPLPRAASAPSGASKRNAYSVTNVTPADLANTANQFTNGKAHLGQNQSNSFNSNGGKSSQGVSQDANKKSVIAERRRESLNASNEKFKSAIEKFKSAIEKLASTLKNPPQPSTSDQVKHFDALAREYLSFSDKIAELPSIATNCSLPEKLPEDWYEKWPEKVLELQQEVCAYFDDPGYPSDASPIGDKVWRRLPKALHDYKNKLYRPSDETTKRILLNDLLVQLGKILSEYKKVADEGLKKTVVDLIGSEIRSTTLEGILKWGQWYEHKRLSIINKRNTRSKSVPSKASNGVVNKRLAILRAALQSRDDKIAALRAALQTRDNMLKMQAEDLSARCQRHRQRIIQNCDFALRELQRASLLYETFTICLAYKLGIHKLKFMNLKINFNIDGNRSTSFTRVNLDCMAPNEGFLDIIEKCIKNQDKELVFTDYHACTIFASTSNASVRDDASNSVASQPTENPDTTSAPTLASESTNILVSQTTEKRQSRDGRNVKCGDRQGINTHGANPQANTRKNASGGANPQASTRKNASGGITSHTKLPPVTRDEILNVANELSSILTDAEMKEESLVKYKGSAINELTKLNNQYTKQYKSKLDFSTARKEQNSDNTKKAALCKKFLFNSSLLSVINAYECATIDADIKKVLAKVFNYMVDALANYKDQNEWKEKYYSHIPQLSIIFRYCRENTQPPNDSPQEGEVKSART